MQTDHLYDAHFPAAQKIQDTDVVRLYHEQRFAELDAVIVCKDAAGKVTVTFGDSDWNCLPFSRKKAANNLTFTEFEQAPMLQRELKLLTFGWLFNKSPKQRKAASFSSVRTRVAKLKVAYRFLALNKLTSLTALSKQSHWQAFTKHLVDNEYSQSSLEQCFISINKASEFTPWHQLALGFTAPIKASIEAKKLCDLQQQQTLVIPERLCDAIYGKAIELIEEAHPLRSLIAHTENALQDNYVEGKRFLDEKVAQGKIYTFMNADGGIDKHKYASALQENQPNSVLDIIAPLAEKLSHVMLSNGTDFKRYLGQLITSSYIVCGGFSGMRDSELDKLTPDSYFKDTFDGRDYHMLQSHTFKLGEKRETWVTAASSKLAIELMSTLTKRWRSEVTYPDSKYTDSIWLNQMYRSKNPVLITGWSPRLQRFCQQFNMVVSEEDYQECLESNPRSLKRIEKSVAVGQPWPLTPHQFRRTLAFYCIKNRFGTLVALKQQFKHLYLAMTEWYTNGGKLASYRDLMVDEKVKAMLSDINAESTANKIFKQWHSDEKLAGTHGKAIMKMRGDVPSIYSSWEVIYRAVKDGKLTLHGSLHSYCKNGYNCDMDGVVAPQFCVDCGSSSSIIDEEQAKWWQKKHRSLVAYMESGEAFSVSEHSHYITQVRAAEKVMEDFNMDFTPFEAELRVTGV
ncbi:hypothetical protein [Vibrio hibernica]|uniref:hypothetical protein n=1 Tax=Vibrio hibernica TaxID=2587465 RepID=UPI0039AF4D98|nr:hypothetical protein [Vibrio parahaemolyticus]